MSDLLIAVRKNVISIDIIGLTLKKKFGIIINHRYDLLKVVLTISQDIKKNANQYLPSVVSYV